MNWIKSVTYDPAPVIGGYTDLILHVDLSKFEIELIELPPDFKEKYIGGRGYALKMIWDRTNAQTTYDSPENLLVMASGPLCGDARFPGTGKFIVGTISPLTGTFIDSNIGGHFAPILKQCGFDALLLSGISRKEVVLVVDREKRTIGIAEAPRFGKDVDTGALFYGESLLKSYDGRKLEDNIAAVTTGIGARNTRFGIVNSLFYDKRRGRLRSKQAGRGGTGTVMSHKGLRAVIVHSNMSGVRANNPVDEKAVREAGAALKRVLGEMDPRQLRLSSWGTPVLVEYMNKFHLLPVNNFQQGTHPDAEGVFADVFLDRYFDRKYPDGCYYGCNLACAKGAEDVLLTRGPCKGRKVGIDGPEYESIAAVTNMGVFDPQFTMEYSWYCDHYGIDTISMGVTASFLMECVQRGFLTREDIGYDLSWGNIESIDRLLHETATGVGFGRVCGQGVHRAKTWVARKAEARGGVSSREVLEQLDRFAMEVKGLEFSMYRTQESLAQQGGYGFALKGPQHDEAWLIFIDQVHDEIPSFEMKAKALKWFPLIRTWFNAVGLCKLPWIDVRHPDAEKTENPAQNQPTLNYYAKFLNATTGWNKTIQDILNDSERLQLLQKLVNLRQSRGKRKDDQIPLRAMAPVHMDEYEGRSDYFREWLEEQVGIDNLPDNDRDRHRLLIELREKAYERLCDVVYREKGYDLQGVPLAETLEKFGLLNKETRALLEENSGS
ncbi:MAG: aldehyde:ferredoxin oxidoreductase [Deltaproteobacteria bacterium]|nr:aldehyde:ferredoxin oxidoreductase [Deltaproteobacteria bacterium]